MLNNKKGVNKFIYLLFKTAILFCFFIFSAIFFLALTHLINSGFNVKSFKALEVFFVKLYENPLFLWTSYGYWWDAFVKNHQFLNGGWVLYVPLLTPVLFVLYLIWCYIRSVYSFGLWYWLNNRFAKAKDIEKMGLFNGFLMFLGRFHGKNLYASQTSSVLCFGNEGSGKTSCVAVPSILRSDGYSVLALDNSGFIAKCTSGYRSRLGPVFYFDWNKKDNPDKHEYYARWNPLGKGNIPSKIKDRDIYLQNIVRHLLQNNGKKPENYWDWLVGNAMYILLQFYVSKVLQAEANDYFLNAIIEKGRLKSEDKDLLSTYYAAMPDKYARPSMKFLEKDVLNAEDYMPVGSWGGIPEIWQGKSANLIMFADWVKYLFENIEEKAFPKESLWKQILENMQSESSFFGYHYVVSDGLKKLSSLSRRQYSMVFPRIFELLRVFDDDILREKLSSSDFLHKSIHGQRKDMESRTKPVTVYCVSEGKNGKFLSAMFIDLMINESMRKHKEHYMPILAVLDDLSKNQRVYSLQKGLVTGRQNNLSMLMLANRLVDLEAIYGREGVENIVCNVNYKLLLADDDKILSQKLENLAIYGTKSVQIPAVKVGAFLKVKQGLADANYYMKIAKNVLSKREIMTRGYQMILAEGFYHLPVLAHSVLFFEDDLLKKKATLKPEYFLMEVLLGKRNLQDADVPGTKHEQGFSDEKAQKGSAERTEDKENQKNMDWWMHEDAFDFSSEISNVNPFDKK